MRQMVDLPQAGTAGELGVGGLPHKVDVINRRTGVPVDQIDETSSDPFDGRNVQLHGSDGALDLLGPGGDRGTQRVRRILDAERHRTGARAMIARKLLRKAVRLGVHDEIDVALTVQGHVLGAVARDAAESHHLEQPAELRGIGRRVFDELETIGPQGILPGRIRGLRQRAPGPSDRWGSLRLAFRER